MTEALHLNGHSFTDMLETARRVSEGLLPNAGFSHLNMTFIPRSTLALLKNAQAYAKNVPFDDPDMSHPWAEQTEGWFQDTDLVKAVVDTHTEKLHAVVFLNRNLAIVNTKYHAFLGDALEFAREHGFQPNGQGDA